MVAGGASLYSVYTLSGDISSGDFLILREYINIIRLIRDILRKKRGRLASYVPCQTVGKAQQHDADDGEGDHGVVLPGELFFEEDAAPYNGGQAIS